MQGFSDQNRPGGLFYDPQADGQFVEALKRGLNAKVGFIEVNAHINDELFAFKACELLEKMMEMSGGNGRAEREGASITTENNQTDQIGRVS